MTDKIEKVSAAALQAESHSKMRQGHKTLKEKLANITGETRAANAVLSEALGISNGGQNNNGVSQMLSGIADNMSTQAAQDIFMGNTNNNPIAALAEHQSKAAPFMGSGTQAYAHGDWQPQAILKETALGKEVEMFRVVNSQNGKKVEYTFRHANVANLVAAALNESNNTNDPRVVQIIQWCNKESSIITETKKLISHYKSVDPGNTKRRGILKNQINEKKLMLDGVRSKLGVS